MNTIGPSGIDEFDPHLLNDVYSLTLARRTDADTPRLDLDIEAGYGNDAKIRLRLGNVRQLRLPDLSYGQLQFGECWFVDVSDRGWEYIKYELSDEIEEWECGFETLTVLGVDRMPN
ncbi:MAG TPA: hypothetical protein PKY77_26515 [Phycisphaerae bacterium]|nr:hypothetical protein [Phycisphaerae bacterium]HRY71049.1 hypothetical protein [Phycisphaerae bacterium]HSA29139.1 hypothetical protein [Phycisphaerae bacterium]